MQEQKWLDENSSQVRLCVVFGGRSWQYKLLTEVQFLPPKVVFLGRDVFLKEVPKLRGQNSAHLGYLYSYIERGKIQIWSFGSTIAVLGSSVQERSVVEEHGQCRAKKMSKESSKIGAEAESTGFN